MAQWTVSTKEKKSVEEHEMWEKDGHVIVRVSGFRWGTWTVTTSDDNPPEFDREPCPGGSDDPDSVDMYNCGYDSELVETTDGCWDECDFDECDEETAEWLEEFLEENSVFDLEEHGWYCGDTEMIIDCEMDIEMIEPTND